MMCGDVIAIVITSRHGMLISTQGRMDDIAWKWDWHRLIGYDVISQWFIADNRWCHHREQEMSLQRVCNVISEAEWCHLRDWMMSSQRLNDVISETEGCHLRVWMMSSQRLNDVISETEWCHLRVWMMSSQRLNDIISEAEWFHLRDWMISSQRLNDVISEAEWCYLRDWMMSSQSLNDVISETEWYLRGWMISSQRLNDIISEAEWCHLRGWMMSSQRLNDVISEWYYVPTQWKGYVQFRPMNCTDCQACTSISLPVPQPSLGHNSRLHFHDYLSSFSLFPIVNFFCSIYNEDFSMGKDRGWVWESESFVFLKNRCHDRCWKERKVKKASVL